jgi:hypothetical protein
MTSSKKEHDDVDTEYHHALKGEYQWLLSDRIADGHALSPARCNRQHTAGTIDRQYHYEIAPDPANWHRESVVCPLGICANKIIPWYDLIGHLIGKGMILLGGARGGP